MLHGCSACGATFEGPRSAPGGVIGCPFCGGTVPVQDDDGLIIDVRARAEGEAPADEPSLARDLNLRGNHARVEEPPFEQRVFIGRLWPGGPTIQGQTWVFRSGGTGNAEGRGCCGCGCLLAVLFAVVFLRGCASFFE